MAGSWDEQNEIIAYEQGTLTKEQTVALFQRLINTGLVWQLHPHFAITAARMLDEGLISAQKSN